MTSQSSRPSRASRPGAVSPDKAARRTVAAIAAAALAAGTVIVPAAAQADPPAAPIPVYQDDSGAHSFAERAADLVSRMTLAEKITQFGASTSSSGSAAVPRLGLKAYRYWNEALHGVARVGEATALPTGLGIASTWNRALVTESLDAVANEARAYYNSNPGGLGLTYWSPTINLDRDPRWGRVEEGYGEDPYLTGQIAGAFVDGLQGDDATYLKSVATVKHFAANNHENSRNSDSSDMDQKTLREYYLPAFQNTVENHQVASLMSAYNRVNGVPAPANAFLLTDVLRRTWGFDGFVTSDCGAIDDVGGAGHNWTPPGADHRVTRPEATAYSLRAGTDIDCSGSQYKANLGPAVEQGLLNEADLDLALVRMYTVRMRTGEFDSADKNPWPAGEYSLANQRSAPAHLALAETMSEEALVLLKNDPAHGQSNPILPLTTADLGLVAVVGDLANEFILGDYSPSPTTDGPDNAADGVGNHPLKGIQDAVVALGGSPANVVHVGNNAYGTLTVAEESLVQAASAVIVVVGTRKSDSSEGSDRSSLAMPRNQAGFVEAALAL
ncbi:MAG: glycoside hydrolase family 3 C-terminal domain-containing protein, partial [Bifidobacteriaceae bacterium]|nr:glycoside hydrolase family 3 C-terminal domain-containing protein [Bifidobacteriaceae bacterium]